MLNSKIAHYLLSDDDHLQGEEDDHDVEDVNYYGWICHPTLFSLKIHFISLGSEMSSKKLACTI